MERQVFWGATREWYRMNPALPKVRWSLRNNINLQQSGVLYALYNFALHAREYLRNYYVKAKRSVAKPNNEGPAAYVLPADDPRPVQQARLIRLLQEHAIEVHRLRKAVETKNEKFPAGSFVIRMDQPYSRLADMLLDVQYYNPDDPRPYDDTGWTLGALFNVRTVRVTDRTILDAPMDPVDTPVTPPARLSGKGNVFLVRPTGEYTFGLLVFRLSDIPMAALAEAWNTGKATLPAGTLVITPDSADVDRVAEVLRELGVDALRVRKRPDVPTFPVRAPRIAIVHSWTDTQTEGWYRLAFDQLDVPYDYISVQTIPQIDRLKDRWDILLFAPDIGDPEDLVEGIYATAPVPWQTTSLTPHLGHIDATDDIRPGMGFTGLERIRAFLADGGVVVVIGSSARFPIHYRITRWVHEARKRQLRIQGTIVKAEVVEPRSPIVFGYDRTVAVYLGFDTPLLTTGLTAGPAWYERFRDRPRKPSGRGRPDEPDVPQGRPFAPPPKPPKLPPWQRGFESPDAWIRMLRQGYVPPITERPRVVLQFVRDEKQLLVSGLLKGGKELAGKPAVIDAPVGNGHVVFFVPNPVWRHQTWGHFAMLFNVMVYHNRLDLGWPPRSENGDGK